MHKILTRQLKKSFGDLAAVPKGLEVMLTMVSDMYDTFDKDRALLERSLEISSRELGELNSKLQGEKARAEETVIVRTRELSDEKARLLASINSLQIGFILADSENKILLKNPAITKILELKENPVSIHDVVTPSVEAGVAPFDLVKTCARCLDHKETLEIQEISFGKKFLRIFCTPVSSKSLDATQKEPYIIGNVFLVEDITEVKVLERAKEEFFAIASHELRTPLTAIRANAALLMQFFATQTKNSDVQGISEDIHTASLRLIKIVHDFLDVSALEQRISTLKKEPLDVAKEVTESAQQLQGLAKEKGLYLRVEKSNTPIPSVLGDGERFKQVIINLLGNAINYTEHGGITVTIQRHDTDIRVLVRDTGIGIAPENQTLLFRKFQQAGKSVLGRDVTQGTGLGLYISKLVIESMRGTIQLEESTPGKGSVFSVMIPTVPAEHV